MAFNLYPAVDESYNFPVDIREALSKSKEIETRITSVAGKKGDLVLSLMDSTAKLDGSTNDTVAIQNFINAAPDGATIIMPVGKTAKISDRLLLTKPITISDWRISTGTNNKAFKVSANDVTIKDSTITGVGISAGYVINNRAIDVTGTSSKKLSNINILNNKITGINDTCIQLEWIMNSQIKNNTINQFNYAGIMLISGVDVVIEHNEISNAVHNKNINSYGIAVSDLDNTVAARSTRVKVHGNTIRNIPDWEGIDTHGGSFISIIGNTLISCRRAIQALVGNEPTRLTAPQNCVIVGNTIDGSGVNGAATGITLYGKTDSSMLAHGMVTGNAVYNCKTPLQIGYTDPDLTIVKNNVGEAEEPIVVAPPTETETDTGWVRFAVADFSTGWSSNSTYPARYRIVVKNDRRIEVFLDGAVSRVSGATNNILILPEIARPGYAKIVGLTSTTSNTPEIGTLDIHPTSGALRFVFTGSTSGNVAISSSYVV